MENWENAANDIITVYVESPGTTSTDNSLYLPLYQKEYGFLIGELRLALDLAYAKILAGYTVEIHYSGNSSIFYGERFS